MSVEVLPRYKEGDNCEPEEYGNLDYDMMNYFWDKHGDLSNYGDYPDIITDLQKSNPGLCMAYRQFIEENIL